MASRLVDLLGISPPIDVFSIASQHAEVYYRALPFDADGFCMNLKVAGEKPKIFVNESKGRSHARRRFTVAHEVGHITIPWHTGSFVDHTNGEGEATVDAYWEYEREADSFAAELLMPSSWVVSVINGNEYVADAHQAIYSVAEVSPIAAAIKLLEILEPGVCVARLNPHGIVEWSGRSNGSTVRRPTWDIKIDFDLIKKTASSFSAVDVGRSKYLWWSTVELKLPSLSSRSSESWREIFAHIMADAGASEWEARRIRQSIAGKMGAAKSAARPLTKDRIYSNFMHSVSSPSYNWLTKHELDRKSVV